jgi:type I site-specific restriction endonuclease
MQQGIEYARLLDVPFVFATNGDGLSSAMPRLLTAN